MKILPYFLLVFLLFFAPTAFGLVELWSLAIAQLIIIVLAFLTFFSSWFYRQKILHVPGVLPLLLLLALLALQILPLPQPVIAKVSPAAFAMYEPILAAYPEGQWLTLSVNSKATSQQFLLLASGIALYVSTIQLLGRSSWLKTVVSCTVFFATGIAGLAIIQHATSPGAIYWLRQAPSGAYPFGPWVNPNQFSGYIELVAPVVLGLCLFFRPRSHGLRSRRERFVNFFNAAGTNKHLFLAVALVILILAVFISLCRAGILSLFFSLVLFQILYLYKKAKRSYLGFGILLLGFAFLFAWAGWDTLASEFQQSFDQTGRMLDDRLTLWRDTLRIILDYPLAGSGFGTFIHVYPLYKTIANLSIYDHAHNDYLEMLADGGILGGGLALWFFYALFAHAWKKIRQRRDRYAVLLGIGCMASLTGVLLHGLTDFNLHNPAVFYYFFYTCGLLVAVVNIQFGYSESTSLLPSRPVQHNAYFVGACTALGLVILLVQGAAVSAHFAYKTVAKVYVSPQLRKEKLEEIAAQFQQLRHLDPLEAVYLYQLANAQWFLGEKAAAQRFYQQAALANPMEGAYLQRLGYLQEDTAIGRNLIIAGGKRSVNRADLAAFLAEYLLRSKQIDAAYQVIREAIANEPKTWKKWIVLLDSYEVPGEQIQALLPEDAGVWFFIGQFRLEARRPAEAQHFFSRAAELMEKTNDGAFPEWWYSTIIAYFSKYSLPDKAMAVLRQAVKALPHELSFRLQLGDYYLSQGLMLKAREEYQQALEIQPGNSKALEQLRRIENIQ